MKLHLRGPAFTGFGGGITAFSRELALALISLGHPLRLVGKFDRSATWHGQPLIGTEGLPQALVLPGFAGSAIASALWHRPAGIISTHLNFGPLARVAQRLSGVPYTLVAHGIE